MGALPTVFDTDRPGQRAIALVGAVDLTLITAIMMIGRRQHGLPIASEPGAALETALPFLVGWTVVALLAGAFARRAITSMKTAAVVTTVAWLGAANVGLILRSSPLFDGNSLWAFNVVITAIGLLVLGTWRVGLSVGLRNVGRLE
ncbi:DUF3054 domain-containing protein [Saliphagus sp. GCM10025334]